MINKVQKSSKYMDMTSITLGTNSLLKLETTPLSVGLFRQHPLWYLVSRTLLTEYLNYMPRSGGISHPLLST